MYVIMREGHMGFWWDGISVIFLEDSCGIFPSRSACLSYLKGHHSEDRAVEIIMNIKRGAGTIISF